MQIEILQQPDQTIIDFLDKQIIEYNAKNWQVAARRDLVVQLKNARNIVIAGSSGKTFGNWLLLKTLWVSEDHRGNNIGSQLLKAIESAAKQRSCNKVLLDTLDFQAMPFYKKHGYSTEWVQQNYPKVGCKYFMSKKL